MQVKSLFYTAGTKVSPTGTVVLEIDGKEVSEAACGNGPVDALVKATNRCVWGDGENNRPVRVKELQIHSLSNGSAAKGQATITVAFVFNDHEQTIVEAAEHHDIVEAAFSAYILALNRYLVIEKEVK